MKNHLLLVLFALISFSPWIACKMDKTDDPEDICRNLPTAAFTADKTNGDAPLTVTFVNTAVGAVSYLWNFGGGVTATSTSPVHTFSTSATYPVTLIVTSNTGCKDTFTMNITVNAALPPSACFAYTKGNGGIAPSEVSFNSSCAQNAASYLWDFGYLDSIAGHNYASVEANPIHLFAKPGRYDVKLTTKNSVNDSSSTINRVVICGPNSNLVNDSCICASGYETDASSLCIEARNKFLGNYIVTEHCSLTPPSSYQISIVADVDISEVKINNFWDIFFNPVIATVSGTAINIASQEPDQDNFIVEGSGSIDTSQIPALMTVTYTITDTNGIPNQTEVCTNSIFVKL